MSLQVTKSTGSKYSYALSGQDARKVRVVGLIGIVSVFSLVTGFYLFVAQSLLLTLLFTPMFLVALIYTFLDSLIMSRYPGFSIALHRKKVAGFLKRAVFPKVAVMIPAAGEDVAIVMETLVKASKIDYPYYHVFLLDDSKDAKYKDHMTNLARHVSYFRRKDVGRLKKAGNLNALLRNITGFDYVLVLDADFVPRPEIIKELMPYAKRDVGIVQSPQHFLLNKQIYKRSKFEYGAALIQRDFYRLNQLARGSLGGAICVGTNALYNIKALQKVGMYQGVGRADWSHSEDVYTGLKMINQYNEWGERYRIEYIPVKLATGTCPADHLSFFKQQNRWATGAMQLAFSRKTLFSRALSYEQKLCYFSNSIYYFYTIALLLSPLQLLALLLSSHSFNWQSTLLFLPSLVISRLVTPLVLRQQVRPVASSLVVISNAYTFAQAFILLLIRRPLGWEATGAKTVKRNKPFVYLKMISSLFFATVYTAILALLILNFKFQLTASIIIVLLFLLAFAAHLIYLHHMLAATWSWRNLHRNAHAYIYAGLIIVVFGLTTVSLLYANKYDIKPSHKTLLQLSRQNVARNSLPAKPVSLK